MTYMMQWYYGYIRVKISGFSVERFLNLCGYKGILIWDITKEEEAYYFKMQKKDFFALKDISRKTGTRVVLIHKYGLPFIIPKIWRRKAFLAGILMLFLLLYGSSFYIWSIHFTGNYSISEDVLMRYLQEESIRSGMRKKKLDIEQLEKDMRNRFPDITWTSARIVGTKLLIEIKENVYMQDKGGEYYNTGDNIVSPYDGSIISIIVRGGVPKVKKGDAVQKGMVLVEGAVPIYGDDATVNEYMLVEPDADILIEHELPYEGRLGRIYRRKVYTGRNRLQKHIYWKDKTLAVGFGPSYLNFDCLEQIKYNRLSENLGIPLFFGYRLYREYQWTECERSRQEAESILTSKEELFEKTLIEKGVQIIEKDVKIELSGDLYRYSGKLLIREQCTNNKNWSKKINE